MELYVTKAFEKQFEKLAMKKPQLHEWLSTGFEKLYENPRSVHFEKKTSVELYTARLPEGNRIAFIKNDGGEYTPIFIGNHQEYDRYLKNMPGMDHTQTAKLDLQVRLPDPPVHTLNEISKAGHIGFSRADADAQDLQDACPETTLANKVLEDDDTLGFIDDDEGCMMYFFNEEYNTLVSIDDEGNKLVETDDYGVALMEKFLALQADAAAEIGEDIAQIVNGGYFGLEGYYRGTHKGQVSSIAEVNEGLRSIFEYNARPDSSLNAETYRRQAGLGQPHINNVRSSTQEERVEL